MASPETGVILIAVQILLIMNTRNEGFFKALDTVIAQAGR